MHTRRLWPALVALAALGLAACGGSGSGTLGVGSGTQDDDFTAFVKELLDATSDTSEPATVNDRDFSFNDRDNPDAYDDVL